MEDAIVKSSVIAEKLVDVDDINPSIARVKSACAPAVSVVDIVVAPCVVVLIANVSSVSPVIVIIGPSIFTSSTFKAVRVPTDVILG